MRRAATPHEPDSVSRSEVETALDDVRDVSSVTADILTMVSLKSPSQPSRIYFCARKSEGMRARYVGATRFPLAREGVCRPFTHLSGVREPGAQVLAALLRVVLEDRVDDRLAVERGDRAKAESEQPQPRHRERGVRRGHF